ncbi:TetR/AcrR family transcriptional regulator [Pseudokordiimonas caeni]|uniref:TetR/AcrR family transcriptional regulator n=1 Tax=Pseudokordiimonas caeni TaxID=2997908 RepID=UPI002810A270|nr:TetR/AcrR family transcriptional regulator [Pseudokordiimonas caeni]
MDGNCQYAFMDEREQKILDAAIRVFTRYGYKRTTMNDIAAEAGIVRQTLYNSYGSKEDVLRAGIRYFSDTLLAETQAAVDTAPDLAAKLDALFAHMILKPFDMMSAAPDAEDIVEGFNTAGRCEITEANSRFEALIAGMIAPYGHNFEAAGVKVADMPAFIRSSAHGYKHSGLTREALVGLLEILKVSVLRLAGTA